MTNLATMTAAANLSPEKQAEFTKKWTELRAQRIADFHNAAPADIGCVGTCDICDWHDICDK